ncbi:hypothetical protein B0J13DRAFT_38750 [Dactylonectria estremocensis]|uniref:Allergen Asp f 4 n=1 Tax=Dactylonectria estremocensis TaxID=1079267 RepID=A0A9P9FLA3_9HYPO|nr:hypothetical protein B0J13DRAFT_38750 [Dactylonectria estremocensis]
MKVSASAILLGAALGVSAHPSGHNAHHNAHRRDFVVANKPTTTVTQYVTAAAVVAAAKATSTTAEAAASTTAGSSDDSSSEYVEFCGGSSSKRATLEEIAYTGNIGTSDDYGCNMMVVSKSIASQYDYTTTFNNDVDEDQSCVCFNKIGPDGKSINGFFNGNEAISFTLPASGSKVVAFEANSQGGCVCGVGEVPLTTIGEFAGTWLEFDFGNTSNDDWSGADASCLVSAAWKEDIPALKVCGAGTCSTIYSGGEGENAYLGGMEAEDGVGLNLAPGKVRLTLTVGAFTGSS